MSAPAAARGRPSMDPRIRQRRQEVVREGARRRRRRVLGVLGLLLLAGLAVAVSRSPLFAITAVRVEGVAGGPLAAAREAAVREAAAVRRGSNLVSADLGAARDRVAALPWVADVEVRREPPSTVAVRVRPRVPLAVVSAGSRRRVVDRHGVVIAEGGQAGLLDLRAPAAALPGPGVRIVDPAVRNALAAHHGLPAPLRTAVTGYRATGGRSLSARIRLDRLPPAADPPRRALTADVRLGEAERLGEKASVVVALVARLRRQHALADGIAIDVRAPANPVIVPAGG